MNFGLTQEQIDLRNEIRTFAENEIAPIAFQLDERSMFPTDIVKEMGKRGWMGLPYSKEYGGSDMGSKAYAIAVEEFSRVDAGVGVILSAHTSLGTWPIATYGTEEQKQKYLVPLCKGEKIGAYGLTEENAGSDASGTETTAVDKGDYYLLNGKKEFITNAPEADIYVVFAVTDLSKGTHGISAFIVERGWEGFRFGTRYNKMGIRSSATAQLVFKDVKVPKENLLGKEGEGFIIAMKTLDGGRIGIAAQALGIAQGAFEAAVDRAKERVQFGKPIGAQQGVSFKIADMATKTRAARLMVYSAADMKDAGVPYGVESAMAKLYASDIAVEVANEALQVHGGSGFIKGLLVERMYRDAKITTIYEGTNEIQRVVIGGALLPRPKKGDKKAAAAPASESVTGERKGDIVKDGTAQEKVDKIVAFLKERGYEKPSTYTVDGAISDAEHIVAFGMGLQHQDDKAMMNELAEAMGATLASSRPIAEEREWMDLSHYVGVSGRKFGGKVYIGFGISGQKQHMLGLKDADTVIFVNWDEKEPGFASADLGVVGDMYEIVPLLTKALQ